MIDLDDIVERWHQGEWPYRRLEDVICEHTGWAHSQYDEWARSGVLPPDPRERKRAS